MVCSPARNTIMQKPRLRQAAIAMIDGMARVGSASQFGPSKPTAEMIMLSTPWSGFSRNRQTTAIATMLVTTGR
jgi:hypothetical protein